MDGPRVPEAQEVAGDDYDELVADGDGPAAHDRGGDHDLEVDVNAGDRRELVQLPLLSPERELDYEDEESDYEEEYDDDDDDDDDDDEDLEVEGEAVAMAEEGNDSDEEHTMRGANEIQDYDLNLPSMHSYLGEARELTGRTMLDEDTLHELVIFHTDQFVLLPGMTVPISQVSPREAIVVRHLSKTTRTFGSIFFWHSANSNTRQEAPVGTTAEIQFLCDSDIASKPVSLRVKGRQRFRIISSRHQVDGTRIAQVEILREVQLGDPLYGIRLSSRDRLRPCIVLTEDKEDEDRDCEVELDGASASSSTSALKKWSESFLSALKFYPSQLRRKGKPTAVAPFDYRSSKYNHLRTKIYSPPLTSLPPWVYEQYDLQVLVQRIHECFYRRQVFKEVKMLVPPDPVQLSFWIAANLPLNAQQRLRLLRFDTAVQRLRYELRLLDASHILCCESCTTEICYREDIFSMSTEGPQGTYVNPHGCIHEALTVKRAKNLDESGIPTTEYSWFPGYAWSLVHCSRCGFHIGWKFVATKSKLRPQKFWGLTRRSIKLVMNGNVGQDGGDEDRIVS